MSIPTRPEPQGHDAEAGSPGRPARKKSAPPRGRGLGRRLVRAGAPALWAIFAIALLLRLAWVLVINEPLQYNHPYQYLGHSLWLAEREAPLDVILHHDNWRVHYDRWTAAPLYYLFLFGILRLLGPDVLWVRLIQCVLGGLAAVWVARIGARMSGSRGRWAGIAFAVYLPLIQICATTLTEALYVPLLVLAFDLLLRAPSRANALRAGLIHGLAALTRSVSSAFFAIIAFWMLAKEGVRRGTPRVALLALGGMLTILPWAARNYVLLGEPILIETFAWENLWYANALVGPGVKEAQRQDIVSQKTTAEQRERAVEITLQNLRRRPDRIPGKIGLNFEHLIRPEGLHQWLTVRADESMGRQFLQILLEDVPYLVAWAGFVLFLFKRRWNQASLLTLLWLAYSLLMVVVLFHNEVRYRNQIAPFLFAAGIAGWFGPGGDRRSTERAWIGRTLAAATVLLALSPYPARVLAVARANADARDLSIRAPGPGVDQWTFWAERVQSLADRGLMAAAAEVVERLGVSAPLPVLTLAPRILTVPGVERTAAAQAAWDRSAAIEWTLDETRLQAIAWRRLPASIRPTEVRLGSFDLGLIEGFGPPLPRGGPAHLPEPAGGGGEPTSRWTRGHSRVRLCSPSPGPATLTLTLAAPYPAPGAPITSSIRFDGQEVGRVAVGRAPTNYEFAVTAGTCPGVVEIRSPVWSTPDPPAELGVRLFFAGLKAR